MSDVDNPFQSPETEIKIIKPLVSQGILTDTMLKYLCDASPWLRFMGIMGFIGSGFTVLLGFILIILSSFSVNIFDDASFFSNLIGPFSIMIAYALYSLGAGLLMFFPALFCYRFGAKIRNFILTNSESELEQAFKNNKSLWKFTGILTIIAMAIIPMMIIIMIIAAVAVLTIG